MNSKESRKLYVADTCAVIECFKSVFENFPRYKTINSPFEEKVMNLIKEAVSSRSTDIRLVIPSVVFLEIFEKWVNSSESQQMVYYECYTPIKLSPNIEVRSIDAEVVINALLLRGTLVKHDLHDKIILASAMALDCPLISTDRVIHSYVNSSGVIPKVIC